MISREFATASSRSAEIVIERRWSTRAYWPEVAYQYIVESLGLDEGEIFNAAFLCAEGKVQARQLKSQLPNYGVFDEPRNFAADDMLAPMAWRGISLGVMICEDMWLPFAPRELKEKGADILIVPHGSPFRETADDERLHAAHGVAAAREIHDAGCRNARKIINKWARQDRVLDRTTRHGKTQGVRLD